MAFDRKYLHKIESLGLGGTLWCYDTTDQPATVNAAAYFNGEGSEHIRLGDLVYSRQFNSLAAPSSVTGVTLHAVTTAGAVIDLSAGIAVIGP